MGEAGGEADLHDLLTLLVPPPPVAPRPGVPVSSLHSATPAEQRKLLLATPPRPNDPQEAAQRAALGKQIEQEARYVPGVPPNIVVLADGTGYDLKTGAPAKLSAIDQGYVALAHKHYQNLPKYTDYKDKLPPMGRPFQYAGDPSAEEQSLTSRFLAGDERAAGPLSKLRMARLQTKPRPGIDKVMRPLTLAALASAFGAMAAPLAPAIGTIAAGAIGGGVGGGATSTVASHGDMEKSLLGLGTGAIGGAAGGAVNAPVSRFLGGGIPGGVGGGAAGGAVTGAGKVGLTAALGGEANPWDILMSTLGGGFTGGLSAAGMPKLLSGVAGSSAAAPLRAFLPAGDPSGFKPEAPGQFPTTEMVKSFNDASLNDRRAQIDAAMEDFKEKLAAFESRKAEALAAAQSQYDAKFAEFRQRAEAAGAARDAALARLRQQAASYLEQAQTARRAPLPPIPVPQGPAPLPPPDPFSPSAALQGQTFGGDFPTTAAGDFPISQEGAPATTPSAPPRAAASPQTLPLNIQQIQAALAARRRRNG